MTHVRPWEADGIMCTVASRVLTQSQRALLRKHKGITLVKPLGSLSDAELDDWIAACIALERMSEAPPAHSAKGRRQFRKMRFEAAEERERRRLVGTEGGSPIARQGGDGVRRTS